MSRSEKIASLKIDRAETDGGSSLPWILLAVVLAVAAGAALWWWWAGAATAEVRTAPVREVGPRQQDTVLDASGYVTARREATVSSKVTGRIVEVLIEEGMHVQTGQLMARLDDSNARVNLRLAEAEVEAAASALEETRVLLREAERDLDRVRTLRERGVTSQAEVDSAQAEVDSLRARLQRQERDTQVARERVAVWRQEIADREIRAPFAGVVVTKDAQPGEMISPVSAGGGFTRTGIGTVVDMDSLEIEVDVNESYINRVRSGQPVEAVLDAYPDWKIPAEVIAIVPTADRQRATVKVRIGFARLDPRILPDMGVKVAFREAETEATQEERAVLVVPAAAIREHDGRRVVLTLVDGSVERRPVTLGAERAEGVVVLSGLTAGQLVVVDGPESLAPGDPVREVER